MKENIECVRVSTQREQIHLVYTKLNLSSKANKNSKLKLWYHIFLSKESKYLKSCEYKEGVQT